MPNPNNQNENQLSEVKKTLDIFENQMRAMQFEDRHLNELHENFSEALHRLSEETDRYYTMDAQGNYPIMNARAFAQFENLYREAYRSASALETGLQQAVPAQLSENDRNWRSVYNSMTDMIRSVLGQDLQHLHSVQRHGNENLPALIEQSRTHVYNVDGQEMAHFGANVSNRLAITIPGPNGDVRGFFTESVNTTKEEEQQTLVQDTMKEHPELRQVLQNAQLQNYNNGISIKLARKSWMDEDVDFLKNMLEVILPEEAVREQLLKDDTQLSGFLSFLDRYDALESKYESLESYKTGKNDKTDQRNCAMSAIADLMGMQDLLAHAEPVQIQFTKNGQRQTLSGSFMHFANGQDITQQIPGQGLLNVDAPVESETASVKKQMADLQVLDYICGNVDRHSGNFFYQLDETDPAHPRLVGIQGIDNDTSFTTYVGNVEESKAPGQLPIPTSMLAIRKQTAAQVEALDRDMLKTLLRNYALTEEQVDAVWTRTQKLQAAIREGREFFREKPADTLSDHHLRELDDDAFERIRLENFADSANTNHFQKLKDVTLQAAIIHLESAASKAQTEYLNNMSVFHDQFQQFGDLWQKLKDADSVFRKRPEYSELLRSVKSLDELERPDILEMTADAVESRLQPLQDAMNAAKAYMQHKRDDYNRERQAVTEKFERDRNDRARRKSIAQIKEKYFGQDSADAKRIRAVKDLWKTLKKCREAGNNVLNADAEYKKTNITDRQQRLAEIRRRSPQQIPVQEIQQPVQGRRKYSVAELQNKLGLQNPNEKKTAVQNPTHQKKLERRNSI